MTVRKITALLAVLALVGACSSGGGVDAGGVFQLIEFLESGKDNIARNRVLTFRFSQDVAPGQDLFERIKIQNVQGAPSSSFSRAIGFYDVSGDRVNFIPQYPELPDRSDAGMRANGSYHVFLKSGADSLVSGNSHQLAYQQEFLFNTSQFFEDILPTQPPRALALIATDRSTGPGAGSSFVLSRLDPRPAFLALIDNATLMAAPIGAPIPRLIEPGAGGAPSYATPWEIDLVCSEPLDPNTIHTGNVQMFEIRNDAFNGVGDMATPGHFGTLVSFRVPIAVALVQRFTAAGLYVAIRVTPQQTLVDDARYRIVFSGAILGLDFRKTFIGDNGLTGDGTALVGGVPLPEVGGLGYTSEFLVADRAPIASLRALEYDPLVDGIMPETGPTTLDPAKKNSSLYNPATNPSRAVGFLSAFGDGNMGPLSVGGGLTVTIDTGDVLNAALGNPFSVTDADPTDSYNNSSLPTPGLRTFDSMKPTEWQFASLTVSASSVLRIIGRNPARIRVAGIVQVAGTLTGAGSNGAKGGGGTPLGGAGGPGGFAGGNAKIGSKACPFTSGSCGSFDSYLNNCAGAKAAFPFALHGNGPGRGLGGGDMYGYYATDHKSGSQRVTGTGGGGGSYATAGTAGEDVLNIGGSVGTPGPACGVNWNVPNGSVIGVRGRPGPVYGDRLLVTVLMGGSSGAAGGSISAYQFVGTASSGGAGGGGGGIVEIIASGNIVVSGVITVAGGSGGQGVIVNQGSTGWDQVSGSGGAAAGGGLALISGSDLVLTGALLDARGGVGGLSPEIGTSFTCTNCNAGGDGGKGFIFLMDADGAVTGFLPGMPGNYDGYVNGVLTIRSFDASRFSSISAITELFGVRAANPDYADLVATEVVGIVAVGQRVLISMSTARARLDDPLRPDLATEPMAAIPVATIERIGPSVVTTLIPGAMAGLNPAGAPARDAFLRVVAAFEYTVGVEAAIGPFAMMERVTVRFTFN
ncbi:MAG: hypothetical protein ACT4PV_02735 [Planctomycetaceae bacterium]